MDNGQQLPKRTPGGVTILAIWALVGSCVVFGYGIVQLTESFHNNSLYSVIMILHSIAVPMGAIYTIAINGYVTIIFGIVLAAIGVLTLKRRSKGVWIANIGLSILAVGSAAFGTYIAYYELSLHGYYHTSIAGLDSQTTEIISIIGAIVTDAVIAIRLHYLLRRSTRDFFFNEVSQQTLAPDAQ